ncbi:uncharacterized protein MELLADRAFT_60005 [Melampsora larici-populina 98AG31]|uniref:Uncharacterized protein n=1 Tax=Melampsora larici-populina (strain 98AG31 / pathotype 3-4-7) TaxID=747676 RepID=F4R9L9_MELLP|nr:uncharacterized protein MELLADRAFT_60005 [Melampsora larici-populina 98AG31]EGG11126.1 hypothetical protein MELLADRAFT_60005 [Melampsora larici-populina 98AG31]
MNFMITNYQQTTRYEELEAFKLQLALELLMGPAHVTPSLMGESQISPSTSCSSLPASLNPSPTVPFRQAASYPHRPPNPALERRRPMPLSFGNAPNEDRYGLQARGWLKQRDRKGFHRIQVLSRKKKKMKI